MEGKLGKLCFAAGGYEPAEADDEDEEDEDDDEEDEDPAPSSSSSPALSSSMSAVSIPSSSTSLSSPSSAAAAAGLAGALDGINAFCIVRCSLQACASSTESKVGYRSSALNAAKYENFAYTCIAEEGR